MYHGLTIVTEQNEPANGWQQLLHCDSITVTLTLLQFLLHVTTVRGFLSLFLALTWDQWIVVHTWGLCVCVSSRQKEVIGRLTVTRTGPQWHQHRSTRPLHDCKHAKHTTGREDHNEKREKKLTPLSSSERKSGPSSSPSCCWEKTERGQNGWEENRCALLRDVSEDRGKNWWRWKEK